MLMYEGALVKSSAQNYDLVSTTLAIYDLLI